MTPEADTAVEAFTLAVSHDLRAPLRIIDGVADALAEDYAACLPPDAHHLLSRLRQASSLLERRLDGLLRLSHIGRDALHLATCDLAPTALRILQDCRRSEPDRAVAITVPPSIDVTGDAALLGIVMENLLTNAWKFTRQRAVARIDIEMLRSEADVVVSVRDNGVGFDMRQAHRLGVPFQRLHASERYEGIGVGLASTRRIVERHGGRVWADGAPGAGATFHLSLPSVPTR